jgi:chromosome segregation ATPase
LEREKLARLNGQHRALEESYREAVDQLEKANQAITRHIREIKSLKQQIDRQEVAVQDLKNDLEEDTPQTGVLEEYEKSLKEAQENQEMYKSQFGDSVIEKDRIGEQAKPFRAQLATLDGELAEINERIKKAEAAVEQATHTKTVEVKKSNDAHERAESAVQWKIQLETARDGQVATVNEFTMQAEQVSRRVFVDDGETTDSLNAKLTKLQKEQARQREQ